MIPIIVATIGATAVVISGLIAAYVSLKRGQEQIHILVNNRLTEALNEIRRLGGKPKDF